MLLSCPGCDPLDRELWEVSCCVLHCRWHGGTSLNPRIAYTLSLNSFRDNWRSLTTFLQYAFNSVVYAWKYKSKRNHFFRYEAVENGGGVFNFRTWRLNQHIWLLPKLSHESRIFIPLTYVCDGYKINSLVLHFVWKGICLDTTYWKIIKSVKFKDNKW